MSETRPSTDEPGFAPAPAPGPTGKHGERTGWRRDGPRFVLVAWAIATVASFVVTAGAAVVVSIGAVAGASLGGERSSDRLGEIAQEALTSPVFVWGALIAAQATMLVSVWLACRILGKGAHERLGLVATGLRPVQAALLLVATPVPFALGLVAASLVESVLGSSSEDALGLQRMWSEGSRGASAAWVLLIALLPGFAEEVFYRGFLQRGLLLRWGPTASILTVALLFAVVHGDPAWAAGIFPLGVWLGIVAWRTGSVLLTFAMHACVNGLWTAGMMIVHRDPTSELVMVAIGVAVLIVGALAFPWAIFVLRRSPAAGTPVVERRPQWLLPRVAGAAIAAGVLVLALVPPGPAPTATAHAADGTERPTPTLDELEASAVVNAACTAVGDAGAVEVSLAPGVGARVALPENRVGIDEVIVALDAADETVWLAYGGEFSGKGGARRPVGIIEQLAPGDPTVLYMTLTPGPPPVTVRLTFEEEEAMKVAAFERARAEGWAIRGRR